MTYIKIDPTAWAGHHIDPQNWDEHARCRGVQDHHPDPTDKTGIEAAKARCRRCPVMIRCREDAIERGERHGVWGGLDHIQLDKIRLAAWRARTAATTAADQIATERDTGAAA